MNDRSPITKRHHQLIYLLLASSHQPQLTTHPQIDWNKVASHPLLEGEITNGHAARMRYSRFKRQIEGTAPVSRKPRNPNNNHNNNNTNTNAANPASSSASSPPKKRASKKEPVAKRLKTES